MSGVGATVHYGEYGDGFCVVVDDIMHAIVVDEHETDTAGSPRFTRNNSESLRHGVEFCDGRVKVVDDSEGAVRGFEFVRDIAPEVFHVRFGLGSDDDRISRHLRLAFE